MQASDSDTTEWFFLYLVVGLAKAAGSSRPKGKRAHAELTKEEEVLNAGLVFTSQGEGDQEPGAALFVQDQECCRVHHVLSRCEAGECSVGVDVEDHGSK